MQQTIKLIRVIGSPFSSFTESPKNVKETKMLLECASKNRMALLFLESLKKEKKLGSFSETHKKLHKEYLENYGAISRISKTLNNLKIKYGLFKSIRPYPYTTSDIDVLLLGKTKRDEAEKHLVKLGYLYLGKGPLSTTIRDPFIDIGIDLYEEVGVSHIVYLDKEKLGNHIIKKSIDQDGDCLSLSPSADLIALIAHSIIKEHMYTLSEYYSTLFFIFQMNKQEITNFIEMIKKNAIVNDAQCHIGITAKLHKLAFGKVPEKIMMITDNLGINQMENQRLKKSFYTPHKLHPLTIARGLIEKAKKEKKTRRSIAKQIISMLNPNFANEVMINILYHVLRETY
jgi:hypothetical protein